jgi:hypothetical protein
MQGDIPSQSKGGHTISDANEADKQDNGGGKEKGALSKSHRKTVNPAHQTLKRVFESKSRYYHSPTQPQHELELDLIMGRNPPNTGTFKALPGILVS